MEIYDYVTNNGELKYGFKIYTDDSKSVLSYEAAGFNSYAEAQKRMNEVLADFQ
jgi:hypothetical protein